METLIQHDRLDSFHPDIQDRLDETVLQSDCYELKFWKYDAAGQQKGVSGYVENFCLTYVYSGNLRFDLFNREYDLHTGHILIDKPQYEFHLPPATGVSTVFRFYPDFYRQLLEEESLKTDFFFANQNLLSLLLASNPDADYLHYEIIRNRFAGRKLEMDSLVMGFLYHVVRIISDKNFSAGQHNTLKKYHIAAVEQAKDYMHGNFSKDISLKEVAAQACISMFHFSRVFKQATSFSPHQYLLNVRLQHAELLLKNTAMPISAVAAASGFRMPEYFATSFRQKFNRPPNEYRKEPVFRF
jgi:AraC-like DNA-binding protein